VNDVLTVDYVEADRLIPRSEIIGLQLHANATEIRYRDKQLQCRDYWMAGTYYKLQDYKWQDWNVIEIRVSGTSAFCTCNGEVLSGNFQIPEDGPIGLEADRGKMEYRNIRIQEAP
jgi:hypothetical protein